MHWLTAAFELGFQQRALIGGLLAGLVCSMVGVWMVLRGMSFFGDALVHGVLPGLAAAVVFGFSPFIGAAVAVAVMVGGIELIHRRTHLHTDTSIGLLFVGMLALGVAIISRSRSYTGSLTAILFGDAFSVTEQDLWTQAILGAIVLTVTLLLYRPLLALSFSPLKAQTLGMRPKLAHALLLMLIAAAIIGSFQAVGTLLVFALLVGPPATATLISRSIPIMFVWSLVCAAFCVVAGLLISYHLGTAGAATIALLAVLLFFVVFALTSLKKSVHSTHRPHDSSPVTTATCTDQHGACA